MTTDAIVPSLAFTEAAIAKLQEIRDHYPEPVAGFRLKIAGRTADGFAHVLTIVEAGAEPADDVVADVQGLRVFVEGANAENLRGVAIHYAYKGPGVSGLEFDNPNPVWDSDVALALQELIDHHINPSIAGHGGWVRLHGVDQHRAYIEMGGGCQGCGMASVTLKQGIEVMIKEALPEIEEVVDVTDHASGTNPYFQPSKK